MNRFAHRLGIIVVLAGWAAPESSRAVTIPTVPIGNPGNPADTRYVDLAHPNGVGSVTYPFRIGGTEVTNSQYVEFLNAVAASDPYGLYSELMGGTTWGGIVRSGTSGNYTYAVKAPALGGSYNYDHKPVVWVSWGDAARFANWLHNGQPTGAQDTSTTEDGAYTLNGAVTIADLAAITRNPGARWWFPSEDEWYKAAFYDPSLGEYYDYPTGTNSEPNNNLPSNDTGNSANFPVLVNSMVSYTTGDIEFPLTDAGAYTLSVSPYGTYDQGGGVFEWSDSNVFFDNFIIRGGGWSSIGLHAADFIWRQPSVQEGNFGFRVATIIPEPSSILLLGFAFLGALPARRRFGRARWLPAAAIVAYLIAVPAATHAAALRTVALSGQQATGTPAGVSYFDFNLLPPVLNDAGQTAFRARLVGSGVNSSNNEGIWSEGSGSLALVARTGTHAPGTAIGVTYDNLSIYSDSLVINDAGQTAFQAGLTGGDVSVGTNDQGIWSEGYGSLVLVARNGNPAPGNPSGLSYNFFNGLRFNNAGQTAFWANAGDTGVWSDRAGSLALAKLEAGFPVLNDAGQIAFNTPGGWAVWSEGSGSLELVVENGSPAHGTPSGVNYHQFASPVMNNAGQIAFFAYVSGDGVDTGNERGIWSEGSGSLALVARSGSHAPGTPSGVNYLNFSSPVLNHTGQTAFSAFLIGNGVDGSNAQGIWSEASGSLALVARSGGQAPGTPSGVDFESFDTALLTLNDAGQAAFSAGLTDGTSGIWATDRSGAEQLIARSGDLLEVAPGDYRTISALSFVGNTGNDDGRPSGFNNLGQLAFWASFTEGTEGIFVSNRVAIPEPASILLLALGAVGALTTRRRFRTAPPLLAAAIIACVTAMPAITHAAELRTVALSGQQAPGTPDGVSYFDFYLFPPVLNDAGQTAFRARLIGSGVNSSNNEGIWSEGSGSLALVARTGSQAPGTTGNYQNFLSAVNELVINNAGQTAFRAVFNGIDSFGYPADYSGVWSEGSGSLAKVAIEKDFAPTQPYCCFLFNYGFSPPLFNDSGQTAFGGSITPSAPGGSTSSGIWSEGSASLNRVYPLGDPTFDFLNYQHLPVLNDSGQTAFFSVSFGARSVVWSEGSGGLARVAQVGDHAPGTPSGVTFADSFGWLPSSSPALNNAGHTAFRATVTGTGVNDTNDTGIWSESSGSLALIAREGDPAPGLASGVNFSFFRDPVLNNARQTAFWATLSGNGVDPSSQAIWLAGSNGLELVVRTGDQAPGTPSWVTFSVPGTANAIAVLRSLVLNNAGQVAFAATVDGPGVDNTNNFGIWATDRAGALHLIARTGDLIEVTPGDFRTIRSSSAFGLAFAGGTGNSDGLPSGFNNVGQLAFMARFTDGSSGIFVSNAVAHLPGDFNHDGAVNAADYVMWRKTGGSQDEYNRWRANFGQTSGSGATRFENANATVPEPTTLTITVVAMMLMFARQRARK